MEGHGTEWRTLRDGAAVHVVTESAVPESVVSRRRVGGSCVGSESEIPACHAVPLCHVVPMCAEWYLRAGWFLFSYACRVVPMSVVPAVGISVFGIFVSSSSCVR